MSTQASGWIKLLVLTSVVLGLYWNALHSPFIFDDRHVIEENPSIRQLRNIPSFFIDPSHFSVRTDIRHYRPVFLTSLTLSWALGDGATWPFHLVSVGLHAANVVLLLLICQRLFSGTGDASGELFEPYARWGALAAATAFAVHPLATQAINLASAQSVPLAAFFFLLSFHLFLTAHSGETAWRQRRLRVECSCAAYALALLSKPIAITLPVVLVLWGLLFGVGPSNRRREAWRKVIPYLPYLPYLGVSIAYLLARSALLTEPFSVPEATRSAAIHYMTQTKVIVFYYLRRALLPVGLNVDVAYPNSTSWFEPQVIAALAVLGGLGWLLLSVRSQRNVVFWSLWLPTCLFVTTYGVILHEPVNEHRAYLSLAGLCALAGFLVARTAQRWQGRYLRLATHRLSATAVVAGAVVLVLGTLAHGTRARNELWSSTLTLWEDAVRHGGTWRAHMNYALALEEVGRAEEALAEFETAVKKGPYQFAHINLGLAQVKRGNLDQGLAHLQKAVRLRPTSPEAHFYLGYGLSEAGKTEEAERAFREALARRPSYALAYQYLATLYETQERWQQAIATWQRLLAIDSTQAWVEKRIGWITAQHGIAGIVAPES